MDQSADTGIFVWSGGTTRLALREGQPLPEVCPDCIVGNVRVARLDDSGRVMASVDARSGNAVVANAVLREVTSGDLRVLAFTGGPAPLREGETVTNIAEIDLAGDGTGVVSVTTTGPSRTKRIVYALNELQFTTLAVNGEPSSAVQTLTYDSFLRVRAARGGIRILQTRYSGGPMQGIERHGPSGATLVASIPSPSDVLPGVEYGSWPTRSHIGVGPMGDVVYGVTGQAGSSPPMGAIYYAPHDDGPVAFAWAELDAGEFSPGFSFSSRVADFGMAHFSETGQTLFTAFLRDADGEPVPAQQLWHYDPATHARMPVAWPGAPILHSPYVPAQWPIYFSNAGIDREGNAIFGFQIYPNSGSGIAMWSRLNGRRIILDTSRPAFFPPLGALTPIFLSLGQFAPEPTGNRPLSDDGRFAFSVSARRMGAFPPVGLTGIYTATIPNCDFIDFNLDGLTPDVQDLADFLAVFSGDLCAGQQPGDAPCNTDIDFNNDGLALDNADIEAFFTLFGGGNC
ncbi:MAG TPA: hypothetical protein VD971_08880 [Phycisphaerales bacterium]|nr:hypothetical protein [Phycisphaerales bacterium]